MRSRRPIHINFSLRGMYLPSDCLCLPMICCMTASVDLLKALVIDMQIMQFGPRENDNYPPIVCIEVVVGFIQTPVIAAVCSLLIYSCKLEKPYMNSPNEVIIGHFILTSPIYTCHQTARAKYSL